jgi:hypothetical protein
MVFKPKRIYHTRISKNPEDNTFSLWFEDRPEKLVISLLYAVGFKAKAHEREFYHFDDTTMMEFAEDLKATLSIGCFPFHVPYEPSYSHTQDSIDADNYSVVTFHYENQIGLSETYSTLIMERTKERREGLSHILGVYKFGNRLQSFNSTYRTGKAEARELLKNGVYEVSFPTPFGAGCPARLDFDSKDKPFQHQAMTKGVNLTSNDEANDLTNDESNGLTNDRAPAKESSREDLREKTNDLSNGRYNAVNQETNGRSNDRSSSREDLHERVNDRSNDRWNSRRIGRWSDSLSNKAPEKVESSSEIESDKMEYENATKAENVSASFFDLFETKLLSLEETENLDQSQIRDEFNLLVSQELLGLDENEVETLWSIYSASERGISFLELDDSTEDDQPTSSNYVGPILEEPNEKNPNSELSSSLMKITENSIGRIQVSTIEVVSSPSDWEQDLTFENWTELSSHFSDLNVQKLSQGYGIKIRVVWENQNRVEVQIPLFADGYNPVIDPLIFGKKTLAHVLRRINELEKRFQSEKSIEVSKSELELSTLKTWKSALDFGLSEVDHLHVERTNQPKIPIKSILIDLEDRPFVSLSAFAEWQRFTKASEEIQQARSLFGSTEQVNVNLEWVDGTKAEVSIPVITIPKSWTSENWRILIYSELGESEAYKFQSSDLDPLLHKEEIQEALPKRFRSALEHAYWRGSESDTELRVFIDGEAYHENELYFALMGQLRQASEEIQNLIGQEITERFDVPHPFNEYVMKFQTLASKNDSGSKSVPAIEAFFLDIDTYYREEDKSIKPIFKFLIDQFVQTETLADLPTQHSEEQSLGKANILETKAEKETEKPKRLGAKKRFETNKKIEAIIDSKLSSGVDFTSEEKEFFRDYSGYGGLISQGANGAGILYEYYTDAQIIEKMWGLAYKYGFTGGRILEPSVGIGDFLKIAPQHADVTAYEINSYSATICQLLYPTAKVYNKAFETIFFSGFKHLKDNHNISLFDLVIGNPPYGEFSGKYAGMGEKKFTKAKEYDHYFITRGIDLLRPGGLLVFIIASSFLDSSKSYIEVKRRIAEKAELKDAYRLPNGIFKSTDIGTDIVVFKKR